MRITISFIIIVVSCLAPVRGPRVFRMWKQAEKHIIGRIVLQIRTFYVRLDEQITDLYSIKFRFDNAKEFEEGWLMSVIIEKYRQAVEHMRLSRIMKAFAVYDHQLRLEMVQRIYLDVFRLVNAMHEIPRKYGFDIRKRKRSTVKSNAEDLVFAIKHLEAKELNKKKERRLQLKELKRLREEMQLAGENLTMSPRAPRNTRTWWKFKEYGWEVDDEYMTIW